MSIPIAFDVIAEGMQDLTGTVRRRVRDRIFEARIIERCVEDIRNLLGDAERTDLAINVVSLWDYQQKVIAAGQNYEEVGGW